MKVQFPERRGCNSTAGSLRDPIEQLAHHHGSDASYRNRRDHSWLHVASQIEESHFCGAWGIFPCPSKLCPTTRKKADDHYSQTALEDQSRNCKSGIAE